MNIFNSFRILAKKNRRWNRRYDFLYFRFIRLAKIEISRGRDFNLEDKKCRGQSKKSRDKELQRLLDQNSAQTEKQFVVQSGTVQQVV